MPDFPPTVGATAADVWAYASRTITALTGQPRTDLIGANEDLDTHGYTTARAGGLDNLDAAVSTRSTHSAADVWDVVTRTITALTGQPRTDLMGEDASFEAGAGARKARLDAAISSRSSHTAADIWGVVTRELTGITGTPRTNLLGEDATFEAGSGARKARLDAIPAFETPIESSVVMDGTELTLVEKTDNKMGLLDGYVDLGPMEAGDTIVIREYMIVKAAGSYAKYAEASYSDVQSLPLLHVVTKTAARSIKVTAQQTAGVNRTLDVQFFRRRQA